MKLSKSKKHCESDQHPLQKKGEYTRRRNPCQHRKMQARAPSATVFHTASSHHEYVMATAWSSQTYHRVSYRMTPSSVADITVCRTKPRPIQNQRWIVSDWPVHRTRSSHTTIAVDDGNRRTRDTRRTLAGGESAIRKNIQPLPLPPPLPPPCCPLPKKRERGSTRPDYVCCAKERKKDMLLAYPTMPQLEIAMLVEGVVVNDAESGNLDALSCHVPSVRHKRCHRHACDDPSDDQRDGDCRGSHGCKDNVV